MLTWGLELARGEEGYSRDQPRLPAYGSSQPSPLTHTPKDAHTPCGEEHLNLVIAITYHRCCRVVGFFGEGVGVLFLVFLVVS